jgi:hypothetical protein
MGWIAATVWVGMSGSGQAAVLWSPDGQWLAYTISARAESDLPAPGWLFERASDLGRGPGWSEPPRRPAAMHRLWATRVDTGASVLLEESTAPLTTPSWGPEGKALTFGRLVRDGQMSRYEIVIQEGLDRKRVLLSRPLAGPGADDPDLSGLVLAWSSDGRYLAVPLLEQAPSLGIVRADNGRLLKVIDNAMLPAWSPDGTKLAFVRGGDPQSLNYVDTNFGPPRHLSDIGRSSQAPAWSRDGRWVMTLARKTGPKGADPSTLQVDLVRVQVDGGKIDLIPNLTSEPGVPGKDWRGSWFSFDRAGEELFYTSDVDGQPSIIARYRPRDRVTTVKDNPIDFSVRVVGLAIAPAAKVLALSAGASTPFAPAGLWNLSASTAERFKPIVPDDSTRVEWITNLITAARQPLDRRLPPAITEEGQPAERPSLLPVPGEVLSNDELWTILKRLGRIGRPLCDRPGDSPPASPELLAFLEEAKLFFDYAREDYTAALESLEAIEGRTTSPERRLRLLSLRAQILMGQGQADRAGQTIAFLQSIHRGVPKRIEITPAGATLTDDPDPRREWPNYLAMRAKKLAFAPDEVEEPFGHRNPDNPDPAVAAGRFPFPIEEPRPAMIVPGPPRRLPPILPRFQPRTPPRPPVPRS